MVGANLSARPCRRRQDYGHSSAATVGGIDSVRLREPTIDYEITALQQLNIV